MRTADELTSLTKLEELEALQPGAFSACTFDFGTRKVIVVSPLATDERRRSDASHEASHLLLDHKVREVEQLGGLSFFTCDPDEEQGELARRLPPPARDLLVRSLRNGLDAAAIAEANTISIQMTNFQLRPTGAERRTQLPADEGHSQGREFVGFLGYPQFGAVGGDIGSHVSR